MIFDGMTTEELFTALQSWNKFYNEQQDEQIKSNVMAVIDTLVVTLQLHWL